MHPPTPSGPPTGQLIPRTGVPPNQARPGQRLGTGQLQWQRTAVQMEIYRQMEANGLRMSGVTRPPSAMEDLERLANLRDRGHVSEEEFQRKKRDLLDRL